MGKSEDIEYLSFRIIDENVDLKNYNVHERLIVKKLIHTTGDFDFAKNTVFRMMQLKKHFRLLKVIHL